MVDFRHANRLVFGQDGIPESDLETCTIVEGDALPFVFREDGRERVLDQGPAVREEVVA